MQAIRLAIVVECTLLLLAKQRQVALLYMCGTRRYVSVATMRGWLCSVTQQVVP